MNLRRLVATSALVIASMGVYAGTAYADPTPPAATEGADNINYSTKVEGQGVVTTVDAGIFKVTDDGKSVELLDNKNNSVLVLPVSLNLNGVQFPFETTITNEGRTVTLFPNMAAPSLAPAENKVASPDENLKAMQNFTSQLGLASAIGGVLGTIIAGGPTLVIAGVDYLNTLNAAPGTTQWATK